MSRLLPLLLVIACSGCFWATTKHEGKVLGQRIDTVETEVNRQKTEVAEKVAKLEEVLEEARTLLSRNSADLGTKVDALANEIDQLNALVMDAKRAADAVGTELASQKERIDGLEKRLAELEVRVKQPPPKSPSQLFQEGKTLFDAGQYKQAREIFKSIVVRYSTDPIASEAQYYRGETHFRSKNYKTAIGEFQKVFTNFPKARRADEALFRAGESAKALKWCTSARAYFAGLTNRYPKSSLVRRAKKNLKSLKKNLGKKKYCSADGR
jgi:tol-pal system protein YbgF